MGGGADFLLDGKGEMSHVQNQDWAGLKREKTQATPTKRQKCVGRPSQEGGTKSSQQDRRGRDAGEV